MREQRRFLLCLTAVAVVAAVAQAISGVSELVLYLTPLFLIVTLLLCGRYIGERQIVRRWRAVLRRRPRSVRGRWSTVAAVPLSSQLERTSRVDRGPPAPAFV